MSKVFLKKKDDIEKSKQEETLMRQKPVRSLAEASILALQKQLGNEATATLLGMDSKQHQQGDIEKMASVDLVKELQQVVRQKFFHQGTNLLEYIPSIQEKVNQNIPKQFLNLEMNLGGLVGGLFNGNAQVVLVAFLKNTAQQTANYMQMRRFHASSASTIGFSNAKVLTSDISKGAVSIVMDAAKGAKKMVETMIDALACENNQPTGLETLDRVLPFLNTKKDQEAMEAFQSELLQLEKIEHELKGVVFAQPEEAQMIKGKLEVLAQKKKALQMEIHKITQILQHKRQQRLYFIQMLQMAWDNIKKSEEQLASIQVEGEEGVENEPNDDDVDEAMAMAMAVMGAGMDAKTKKSKPHKPEESQKKNEPLLNETDLQKEDSQEKQ